jgi:hypothetical protein
VNKKLFSTAAVALSLVAGSAFAAADGPDYNVAAQASNLSRAEVSAQAVQAQHEARGLYGTADGNLDVTVAQTVPSRDRAQVKAETLVALRANHDLVNTPY